MQYFHLIFRQCQLFNFSKNVLHHSHITGDIIGYSHSFCNVRVRENENQISVTAHNFFGFDFFFFLKGIRPGSWRTKNISIGGTNLVNINFANIANQVKFIDTLKYYQQSSSVLVATMKNEKFKKCFFEDREWILNYLSSGKGIIPYEMIKRFDTLDITIPEDADFFSTTSFLLKPYK